MNTLLPEWIEKTRKKVPVAREDFVNYKIQVSKKTKQFDVLKKIFRLECILDLLR